MSPGSAGVDVARAWWVLAVAALALVCSSCSSAARKRGKADAVSYAPLPTSLDKTVLPFYRGGRFGTFAGVDGVPIRFVAFENRGARGALVVVNGRTESYAKYAEVAHDLRDSGYALYLIDHRGQGFSGRMLDDPRKGHVERFRDYVADLNTLIRKEIAPRHERVVGLAHSMGGAILAMHLLDHPGVFAAAIFHAPMWQINLGHFNLVDRLSLDELVVTRALSRKDPTAYAADGPAAGFSRPFSPENMFTGSRHRYAMVQRLMLREFGDISIGGPTNKWILEAIAATREIRDRAAELKLPMLVVQAMLDEIVLANGQNRVCEAAANCTLFRVAERHEALVGAQRPRARVLQRIRAFLRQQL